MNMRPTPCALIVDDSRVSRLMTRTYILNRYPDWQIVEAANGEDAIEAVKNTVPHIIFLDVNMPGMGGLAAAEQLRALAPAASISLLTANVQDATRTRASELGVGFMEKPVTQARIDQLLDELAK